MYQEVNHNKEIGTMSTKVSSIILFYQKRDEWGHHIANLPVFQLQFDAKDTITRNLIKKRFNNSAEKVKSIMK